MTSDHPAPPSPACRIEIGTDNEGQRIDNFLIGRLKGVPKSRIYRILRKGEVRVNKGRIRPDYRLKPGDTVRIPPLRLTERNPGRLLPALARRLDEAVLHEDSNLLVINKPSGVAVHGGSGISQGIIETLRAARPDARFLELVHRLDRATSGCLVIAKRRSTLRVLHELLRREGIEKRYLALVSGRWQGGSRRVAAPLRKNQLASGERVVRVDPTGKPSVSLFRPLVHYRQATLVEIRLLTGRTHQARVHAAHAGHPIAGDEKYGSPEFNRRMRADGLTRLFLHAHSLRFRLEPGGPPIRVEAPLEDELQALLERIKRNS